MGDYEYTRTHMLRVTWLFLAEAATFATLSVSLFCMPANVAVARVVASVLAALVLVILVVMIGQRRVLHPIMSAVGLCGVCGSSLA